MNTLFIKWHLGLGDAIVCNGLVRELARRYGRVRVPSKVHNFASVAFMLGDLGNVEVVPVRGDEDVQRAAQGSNAVLGLGLWSARGLQPGAWDQQLYEDAGVRFERRWDAPFRAPPEASYPSQPFAFVHEDTLRGFSLRRPLTALATYEPTRAPHIFWHLAALQMANEVHLIDSAFLCLAESVPLHASKLVFHAYARPGGRPPTLRKPWAILQ